MGASSPTDMPRSVPTGFEPGGFLMVLTGPSGAGKGTLVEHLLAARPDCVFAVSSTTRPRRATETEGVQYHFVDRTTFERRIQEGYFLEWAEVHGQLYGTPVAEVDARLAEGHVVVLDIDVQGGESVRRARPDAVSVFVYPPSLDALLGNLAKAGLLAVGAHLWGSADGGGAADELGLVGDRGQLGRLDEHRRGRRRRLRQGGQGKRGCKQARQAERRDRGAPFKHCLRPRSV